MTREPTLATEERLGVEQRLRELDRLAEDLATLDRLVGEAGPRPHGHSAYDFFTGK